MQNDLNVHFNQSTIHDKSNEIKPTANANVKSCLRGFNGGLVLVDLNDHLNHIIRLRK